MKGAFDETVETRGAKRLVGQCESLIVPMSYSATQDRLMNDGEWFVRTLGTTQRAAGS